MPLLITVKKITIMTIFGPSFIVQSHRSWCFKDLSDIQPEHLPLMIGVTRHREQTSEFLDVAFQFRDPERDSFVLEQEGAIIG